jgi:hypothetical protein
MLRVSSMKALCRAAAAGFLLTAPGWSQAPASADPPNRIGVGRPEWGGETREEHAARMAADRKTHPTLAIRAHPGFQSQRRRREASRHAQLRRQPGTGRPVHLQSLSGFPDLLGVLDTKLYTDERNRGRIFRTVGYGHGEEWWREFVSTLRMFGYDGVLSIEHEDSLMSPEEGLSRAAFFLNQIVMKEKSAAACWV